MFGGRTLLQGVAIIAVGLVAVAACSNDDESVTTPTSVDTTTEAPSTTEAGPVLPVELQRLIDATSLKDLDDAYADVPLPPAASHFAVVVEDEGLVEPPPTGVATASDYVNSLLTVDGAFQHFITEIETNGSVLECHLLGPLSGNCGLPSTAETWTEPVGFTSTNSEELITIMYTMRDDAVLIDTVFADGSRQRSEQLGGIVYVTSPGTIPTTMTLYFADGVTETFDLEPLPEPAPLDDDE